jgi:hypothetical protein
LRFSPDGVSATPLVQAATGQAHWSLVSGRGSPNGQAQRGLDLVARFLPAHPIGTFPGHLALASRPLRGQRAIPVRNAPDVPPHPRYVASLRRLAGP